MEHVIIPMYSTHTCDTHTRTTGVTATDRGPVPVPRPLIRPSTASLSKTESSFLSIQVMVPNRIPRLQYNHTPPIRRPPRLSQGQTPSPATPVGNFARLQYNPPSQDPASPPPHSVESYRPDPNIPDLPTPPPPRRLESRLKEPTSPDLPITPPHTGVESLITQPPLPPQPFVPHR